MQDLFFYPEFLMFPHYNLRGLEFLLHFFQQDLYDSRMQLILLHTFVCHNCYSDSSMTYSYSLFTSLSWQTYLFVYLCMFLYILLYVCFYTCMRACVCIQYQLFLCILSQNFVLNLISTYIHCDIRLGIAFILLGTYL